MSESKITVLWRAEEESWNAFSRRIRDATGDLVVVLSSADNTHLLQEEDRKPFLEELAKLRYRMRLATKEPVVIRAARGQGIRVLDKTRKLRALLVGNSRSAEALRFFSPSLWRQQWRSKLQTVGLLSVPKARIVTLVLLSAGLFLFVILRLLPSAEVRVWARSDIVTQTMNVTLAESGSTVPPSGRVRMQRLQTIEVRVRKSITFDEISPEFTGNDARTTMTVINETKEPYSFRAGTRLLNQAGMIFRIQAAVTVPPGGKLTVPAKADHLDLYDKITGVRGNVPAGLQWEFIGLPVAERKSVYAKNEAAATGGTTAERTVLQQSDLAAARKRLEQELLLQAKQLIEEERQLRNARDPDARIELLARDALILSTYSGFVLPTQFLGQPVKSVPIDGQLIYSIPAYNLQALEAAYSKELVAHTSEGKRLIDDSVHIDPEKVIVIEYADDGSKENRYTGSWIKITADVVGTEQFVLDPLSPVGAKFGKKVREAIAGLSVHDAQRILRNFPEVDRVEIRLWPPWAGV
ncbi:MAG: hypothetical protein HOO67_04185, partial [Candidatus Peribacteraceae bacterium]|nr:hypothetical protein [Candidatus Peribacteraceae bacterium]